VTSLPKRWPGSKNAASYCNRHADRCQRGGVHRRRPIRGSWWGHVAGTQIYAILNALDDSPDVVSTRLVNDKVTLIHARLWPAIARVAYELGVDRLAAIHHEHTVSGAHRRFEVDFPLWVPKHVLVRAKQLSRDQAFDLLPTVFRLGGRSPTDEGESARIA